MKLLDLKNILISKKQNKLTMLYTSIFSIVLCAACLFGTSWAWFTANKEVEVQTIQTATIEVSELEVTGIETEEKVPVSNKTKAKDGTIRFPVKANTEYEVNLAVDSTCTTGFVKISTCDGEFYTTKDECSFVLLLSKDSTVEITTSWGEDYGNAKQLSEGDVLGNGKVVEKIVEEPKEELKEEVEEVKEEVKEEVEEIKEEEKEEVKETTGESKPEEESEVQDTKPEEPKKEEPEIEVPAIEESESPENEEEKLDVIVEDVVK